jgi:predicted nuclease of predicted toxin-antitoxin system
MLPLLTDENFSHRIVRGLKLRIENLDLVLAQGAGLGEARDPTLLGWAADQGRIVLTHDRKTMTEYAYDRVRSHQPMPGIIVVSDTMPVGEAIEALRICIECGTAEDFESLVMFLP